MNSSLWKDNIREIKKTLPRFLSIFAIITLGVAFFVGIRAAGPSMVKTAQTIYEETNLPDGQVLSTVGLNEEDLEILEDIQCTRWLPMQSVNSVIQPSEENVKIYTYNGDDSTNFFKMTEGRKVESTSEIVLDSKYIESLNQQLEDPIEIGDTVTIDDPSNASIELEDNEFTVVGFARSSLFIERMTRSGAESVFAVISDQAVSGDIYTEAYYWIDEAQGIKEYTEEYDLAVDGKIEEIESAFDGRPEIRLVELQDEIQEAIDEGQAEIEDGYQALEDAEVELADAKKELEEGHQQVLEGQLALDQGVRELQDGMEQFDDGVKSYHQGRLELADARAQIAYNEAVYQEGLAQYEEGLLAFNQGIAEGEAQLNDAQSQLDEAASQAQAGYAQLVAGQAALDAGYAQLEAGRQELLNQIGLATNNQIPPEQILAAIESQIDQINAFLALLEQADTASNPEIASWINNLIIERDLLALNLDNLSGIVTELPVEIDSDATIADLNLTEGQLAEINNLLDSDLTETTPISEVISQLNQQLAELQSELASTDPSISNPEIANVIQEIRRLEQAVSEDETRLEQINQQLQEIDSLENLQSQIDSLNATNQSLSTEIDNLLISNQAIESQLSGEGLSEAERASLQSQLDGNNGQIESLRAQQASNQAEVERLQALMNQRQSLETEKSEIELRLETNRTELDRLRTELEDYLSDNNLPSLPDGTNISELQEQIRQLVEAIEMLQAGQAELDSQNALLQAGWQEYYEGLSQLEQAQAAINQGWTELNAQRASGQSQLDESYALLMEGRAQLDEASGQLDEGRIGLEEGRRALSASYGDIRSGQTELEEGYQEALEGRWQLMHGDYLYNWNRHLFDKEYGGAIQDLEDGEAEIADARDSLADLSLPTYIVNDQTNFSAFQGLKNNADQLGVISNIFPVFFLAIAVLVTFTTIKRMASEQRNYMGTMKQLGYNNSTIIQKFVVYAGLAGLLGSIVGIILAYLIFPGVILNAYNMLYYFDNIKIEVLWDWNIIAVLIAMVTVLTPAILTPLSILRTQPANLLVPEPPKSGRKLFLERFPIIWNRFSFNAKMTIRNLLRYKGRNSMTLIGVAGCTMLIVTGFGISNTISSIVDVQFGQLQTSEGAVYTVDNVDEEDISVLEEQFSKIEGVESYMPLFQENYEFELGDGQTQSVAVTVPMGDLDEFSNFVTLRERDTEGDPEAIKTGGPYVTERMGELLNLSEGNSFVIENEDYETFEIDDYTVVENYAMHYIYLTPDKYEEIFNATPHINSFLMNYQEDMNQRQIEEEIMSNEAVLTTVDYKAIEENFADQMGSLDLITLVLIVSAAALAFVVLYNLTNINVAERIRELSTIKVLGFYDNEVSMYIFNEVLVLTFLGGLVGLVFGTYMNRFLLKTMQMNDILFHPTIKVPSYIMALSISFIFSSIVMLIMHRKLKKIDMVEALKGVD